MATTENDRMTTDEAAAYLGVSPHTLYQWRASRRRGSPQYYRLGRLVRYRKSDLDVWVRSKLVTP